jgi:glycosyltransferase involved in cell wall biosynthesis
MRIAYVMSRFPKLSETFVLLEMLALQQHDFDISIYPLVIEKTSVSHSEVALLESRVRAASPLSTSTARAIWHYARHKPAALFGACLHVARANAAPKRAFLASLATLPRAVWMAWSMERTGIEHIHAHFATHATTAAFVVSRLTSIPFSFTAHAQDIYLNQRMLADKVRAAAFVVTISEYNKRFITRFAGATAADKIHVVHCGVDTHLFQPDASQRAGGPFLIVCVGRLVEMKGQTYLIDACRLLKERGIAFQCALIGDGERRKALERHVVSAGLHNEVRFLGGQPRSVVLDTVCQADAVVLPSIVTPSGRMEGIPVALMEALACQRAVVATRISGIPELITDGESGLLVEPGDPRALANALARLANDDALRARLGAAGRKTVVDAFDLEANTAQLAELFATVRSARG